MRTLPWIVVTLLLAPAASAQNPSDVSFTLATKGGKSSFRMGEAITVEFRFASPAPGRYVAFTDAYHRRNGNLKSDVFIVDPAANAVDPMRDLGAQAEVFAGRLPVPEPLTRNALVVERLLNEWISFRQPGRYRILAQTNRLRLSDQASDPVPLKSNTIEIEVVTPEPGWAETRLHEAVASLDRGDLPPPAYGQIFDEHRNQEIIESARVLRFLETRDAAVAMVRFFDTGPQPAQYDLRPGLFGSPYRNEVIGALEGRLTAPDVPVTSEFMFVITELTTSQEFGPRPAYDKYPEAAEAWVQHFLPNWNRYLGMLSVAVAHKQGRARAVSLDVLSRQDSPKPAPDSSMAAVLENFHDLPVGTQHRYLTMDWHRIASPTIEPFVKSLAVGTGPLWETALIRLQELDPGAARKIVIDRIRKGEMTSGAYSNPRALFLLPDNTLRELDDPLVNLLEQGKPVASLVSRYVSDVMFGRIQAWGEANPYSACGGPNSILPYLFRVDPAYAAERLALARKSQPGTCPLNLSPFEDLLMSAGMERAAIADLASPDPMTQRAAQTLLQYGGSAAAEQPLWDGLARLRESKQDPREHGVEYGYVDALSRGVGWILSAEKLDRLAAACISDSCRKNIESMRRSTVEPLSIGISLFPSDTIMVGPYTMRSVHQFGVKIQQFPRGTRFFFPRGYQGTWFYEQRMLELRHILAAAGMEIVDQPPRQ